MIPQKGSIRLLFDPVDEIELNAILERETAFRVAKQRLLHTLADPPQLVGASGSNRLLGACYSSRAWCYAVDHSPSLFCGFAVPWGWTIDPQYSRDCLRVMPLWLWWLTRFWDSRWHLIDYFARAGFWTCKEGDHYRNGHFEWRFWRNVLSSRRFRTSKHTRWERVAMWCFGQEVDWWFRMPDVTGRFPSHAPIILHPPLIRADDYIPVAFPFGVTLGGE